MPLPELTRDNASVLVKDLTSSPSSYSSYGGPKHHLRRPHQLGAVRRTYIQKPPSDLTCGPGSTAALLEISERLYPFIRAIEGHTLCPDLDNQVLIDFQFHAYTMVRTLSESSLLDRVC